VLVASVCVGDVQIIVASVCGGKRSASDPPDASNQNLGSLLLMSAVLQVTTPPSECLHVRSLGNLVCDLVAWLVNYFLFYFHCSSSPVMPMRISEHKLTTVHRKAERMSLSLRHYRSLSIH
jgi:hypothetical protein